MSRHTEACVSANRFGDGYECICALVGRSDPDKTPPPKPSDPIDAVILEQLNGLQSVVAEIRKEQIAAGEMLKAVVETQNKHGRILMWLKSSQANIATELGKVAYEFATFQDHVFSQFQRTSMIPELRVVGDPESNGSGNGNGHHDE